VGIWTSYQMSTLLLPDLVNMIFLEIYLLYFNAVKIMYILFGNNIFDPCHEIFECSVVS
jgi:hypothetical protein